MNALNLDALNHTAPRIEALNKAALNWFEVSDSPGHARQPAADEKRPSAAPLASAPASKESETDAELTAA